MRLGRLRSALENDDATQLAVQAVSRNAVDAAVDAADAAGSPVIVSFTPEQADCIENGGRGTLGWTTRELAEHVRSRDGGGCVLLRRDAAGPLRRGSSDDPLAPLRRMLSADVEAGVDLIHVDASLDAGGGRLGSRDEIDLQTAIYAHAVEEANRRAHDVAFEIGGRQRTPVDDSLDGFDSWFEASLERLDDTGLPRPLLVRARIGTFVHELANIGRFEIETRGSARLAREERISRVVDAAAASGACLSVDGVDYLSPGNLDALVELGIGVAGVGPSLGVRETLAFLDLCDATRSASIRGDFLEAAFETRIWERLVAPSSLSSELERAVMCAHHTFATPRFREFKARLQARSGSAGIDVDSSLRRAQVDQMERLLGRLRPARQRNEVAPVAG